MISFTSNESYAPLAVIRIQNYAHAAECLQDPEQKPRLTGVLADIAYWEAFDQILNQELHVHLLVQGEWRCGIGAGEMPEQNLLRLVLHIGRRCWVVVKRR